MRKHFLSCLFLLTLTIHLSAQVKNIRMADLPSGLKSIDPSIVINPRNPKNIITGIGNGLIQYTIDGGMKWEQLAVSQSAVFKGSPAIVSDDKGTIYYFQSSETASPDGKKYMTLYCYQSDDGGKTWNTANAVTEAVTKDQLKPWAFCDGKGNVYAAWTETDTYASSDPNCVSRILLSKSGNGRKWNRPIEISQNLGDCVDGDNMVAGAMPFVGFDGKIFVTWTHRNTILMDRSFDGSTWLSNDIQITVLSKGRTVDVPGAGNVKGKAVIANDRGKSDYKGVIYVAYTDKRGSRKDSDIWFSRSVNFGDLWTSPDRVNNDNTSQEQYLPWMTVDQSTGYIYILYYDRRASESGDNTTDVYVSWSVDAGINFTDTKISEVPFTPVESELSPEYINVSASKGVIAAIWTRQDDGKTSIWSAVLKHDDLVSIATKSASDNK